MATVWQDFRYALGAMIKSPAFSIIVVSTLAVGIGANTAIFTLLDAVLLKSLPVQEPERLVLFGKGQGARRKSIHWWRSGTNEYVKKKRGDR